MSMPLQITIRHMARSEALAARLRAEADKLSEFHPRIANCRVVVEQLDRHRRQGHSFNVRVLVRVPGQEIAVTRDHDEDLLVAVRDAFQSAARSLEDHAQQRRGDVKAHSLPGGEEAEERVEE